MTTKPKLHCYITRGRLDTRLSYWISETGEGTPRWTYGGYDCEKLKNQVLESYPRHEIIFTLDARV